MLTINCNVRGQLQTDRNIDSLSAGMWVAAIISDVFRASRAPANNVSSWRKTDPRNTGKSRRVKRNWSLVTNDCQRLYLASVGRIPTKHCVKYGDLSILRRLRENAYLAWLTILPRVFLFSLTNFNNAITFRSRLIKLYRCRFVIFAFMLLFVEKSQHKFRWINCLYIYFFFWKQKEENYLMRKYVADRKYVWKKISPFNFFK